MKRIHPRIPDCDPTPQAFRLNKRKVNLDRFIALYDRASPSNDVDYAFGPLGYNFSSKSGWDRFYEQDDENSVFEWHSDVKNEDVVEECLRRCGWCSSFLLVGTGNSMLPRVLYDAVNDRRNNREDYNDECGQIEGKEDHGFRVTCLDYSSVCMQNLEKAHSSVCPNLDFVVGDATELPQVFENNSFDVVIDKGLIDALMCSEGWDKPVSDVLDGIGSILSKNGILMLVSFKLSDSTKEFLESSSTHAGFSWEFDIDLGFSDRVSASIATKS